MGETANCGARYAALMCLERYRRDGAWSGAGIDGMIKKYGLDRRDAALTARLCLGVLQNSSFCDYYIDLYSSTKLEPKLRDILRLGTYQLLFMDKIPHRAAVSESVALCKACGYARASGLVNAVLRRISENSQYLPEIPGRGGADYLSLRYSHPQWLAEYLVYKKGYDFAEAFLQANNRPSKLTIQVNRLKVSSEDYIRALDRRGLSHREFQGLPGCLELEGGNAPELPGFEEGLFYVQDRAARLAVEIAAPRPGMDVLDACACPGGKSFAAAIAMENKGSILARDIHEKKLRLVEQGAGRLGIDIISTACADAREPEEGLRGRFDLVIGDVPCSGFGVIGKKPEIRYKDRESLRALPGIQGAILQNLADFVKPGGVLLYSTCTIFEEENEAVVTEFLKSRKDFRLEPFSVNGRECAGMYTFWPNVDGTDGFFAAKLVRKN